MVVAPSPPEPSLAEKLAFLRRPQTYGSSAARVEERETHLSWVFLTGDRVYKLKKPVLYGSADNRTVSDRRRTCEEEVRLNRRMSPDIYLGMVSIAVDTNGHLRLDGDGRVVDWLVKMRRLPEERMLDRAIRAKDATIADARRLGDFLARFYHDAPFVALAAAEYREFLAAEIRFDRAELGRPELGLPGDILRRVTDAQLTLLAEAPNLFDARLGRIVEGHGDLRPEHICLEATVAVIDCLEFDRRLRTLDTASELAFLWLECQRLGAAEFGQVVFETCCHALLDRPSPSLIAFYLQWHACVRARLAGWHLRDGTPAERAKWLGRAADYLRLADAAAASRV